MPRWEIRADFPVSAVTEAMGSTFDEYLSGLGLSEKTVGIYGRAVRRVLAVCDHFGFNVSTLSPKQAQLVAKQFPNTASTQRQLRTALKHYWEMTDTAGPLRAFRVPSKPRGSFRGLNPDDAKLLAKSAVDWWPEGTTVLLGLYLGLRREEIAGLRWDSFEPDMDWVSILGKGNRTRRIPVHPRLRAELKPHLSAYVYAFPGHQGRSHIHPATIWDWVEQVSDQAGVGKVRPHQLRHTCLGLMNDRTGDLRTTQEFAGHARPDTTAVYTYTTVERLKSASLALDYLD